MCTQHPSEDTEQVTGPQGPSLLLLYSQAQTAPIQLQATTDELSLQTILIFLEYSET